MIIDMLLSDFVDGSMRNRMRYLNFSNNFQLLDGILLIELMVVECNHRALRSVFLGGLVDDDEDDRLTDLFQVFEDN